MLQKIAIKKFKSVVLSKGDQANLQAALTLNAELMSLGYIMSKDLLQAAQTLNSEDLSLLGSEVINQLKNIKGADVNYQPMYPNFPQQVIDASDLELYSNAILHYWSFGTWKPEHSKLPRSLYFENTKFIELDQISEDVVVNKCFSQILQSNDSISEEDKDIVKWILNNYPVEAPEQIPFKENLCIVAANQLEAEREITGYVKTATDILRVVTYLSEGDVSLATNTKFKSLPRATRRLIIKALEKVINQEDIVRHKNKWIRLFHSLHIGEYKNAKKTNTIAQAIRSNKKITTFNGSIEQLLKASKNNGTNLKQVVELLKTRPGEFARRLSHLLNLASTEPLPIVHDFLKIVDQVPTKNLLQLYGSLQTRFQDVNKRIVFPKGSIQKAIKVSTELKKIEHTALMELISGIKSSLINRFAEEKSLGNTWIDPRLKECPLPSQQRSTSAGMFSVARGTRLPLGDPDKNTLRFFIYWKGQDIDLSATLHDENFKTIGQVSYTNLRLKQYEAYHSGDIISAPDGASEFIDITIDQAAKSGARYVAMNVLVFNGPSFAEHEVCYAGWMTREKPNSNEIYDPKTVEQKVDLSSTSTRSVPVLFDLVERKAIWVDLANIRSNLHANNVENNKASIEDAVEAIVSCNNKVSLYELFDLHTSARGKQVANKEEADTIFSLNQGITPFDINVINSDYIK